MSTTIRETCGICGGTFSVTSQYTSSAELIARRWLTNHLCIDAYRRICSTPGCKRAEGHMQEHTTASPQPQTAQEACATPPNSDEQGRSGTSGPLADSVPADRVSASSNPMKGATK